MGYYTYFNLKIVDEKDKELDKPKIIKKVRDMFESASWALDEDGDPEDNCKWYDWEKDMLEVSKEFPKNIFRLSGDGEESDDKWIAYIINGKIQHCPVNISYDPLDLSKIITKKFKPRTLNIEK
jgi:hypothetical protein